MISSKMKKQLRKMTKEKFGFGRNENQSFLSGECLYGYGELRNQLHKQSGIYVYFLNDICLYVGATKYLWYRGLRVYRDVYGCWANVLLRAIVDAAGQDEIDTYIVKISSKLLRKGEEYFFEILSPLCSRFNRTYNGKRKKPTHSELIRKAIVKVYGKKKGTK